MEANFSKGAQLHPLAAALAVVGAAILLIGCDQTPPAAAPTATATAAPAATATPARQSVVGQMIHFKQGGESEQYRAGGWSKTEENFTWSQGTSAKLRLPVGPDAGDLTLQAALAAYVNPPDLASQTVEVYANGTKVTDWEVSDTAEFTAEIPASAVGTAGELMLEFRTPKAVSPKAIGKGDDARVLGIAMHHLQLSKR